MAIAFAPHEPWHLIAAGAAALAVACMLGRGLVDRWRVFGRGPRTRFVVVSCSIAAAAMFWLASLNPFFSEKPEGRAFHLVIAVDVSDSVLRVEGGWPAIKNRMKRRIANGVAGIPGEIDGKASGEIWTFGQGVAAATGAVPLEALPNAFLRLEASDFASGGGTDIAAALARAGEAIEREGGRGAAVLISDGLQTKGDGLAAARRLARAGVSVHVLPVTGGKPDLAIMAADLPRHVNEHADALVRGLIRNGRVKAVQATLGVQLNPGAEKAGGRFGGPASRETALSLEPGQWVRLRQPAVFQGSGIQFLDVSLSANGGESRRRFFTHVNSPIRLLSIGGDHRWTSVFPKNAAHVTRIRPGEFTGELDRSAYDAIVISDARAERFPHRALSSIARAVEEDGVGLMVINGGHEGVDEEAETVLMSYEETPIAPLLPVSSKPRPYRREPPPRQVVILIDASGSMAGFPLQKSKQIARYIVEHHLRPRDRLDLIVFTTEAMHQVENMLMDPWGKRIALSEIDAMVASGGTDPGEALDLIRGRAMTNCGLIFISDGEFDRVAHRPDCRATVFAIGHGSVPKSSPLWELADPFPVDSSFDPAGISIPYFEPKPRKKFFEPGRFTPLSMGRLLRKGDRAPIPDLPLNGSAVTYIKEDAKRIAVRPKLVDPILAYRDAGIGRVGVFTSGLSGPWLKGASAPAAVRAWISRLVPYMARDRYYFKLDERGEAIHVRISLASRHGRIPALDHMNGAIVVTGGPTIGVPLRADSDSPGTFSGPVRVPRGRGATRAFLVLHESGPDALPIPQRIPMLIPGEGSVDSGRTMESHRGGMDETLLRAIARSGAGVFDPPPETPFYREKPFVRRGGPLWPMILLIAVFLHFAAFFLRRLDP